MSFLQKFLKEDASFSWISIFIYISISVCAFFIWQGLDAPLVIQGDASGYILYANYLINGQLDTLLTTFHPYGYPAFLAVIFKAASILGMTSPYPLVFAAQFAIHLTTAYFATRIMRRFSPQPPRWVLYLVFAAVACNPYLLAMVSQLLTENLSIFWITLFFYCLQSEFLQNRVLTRVMIGVTLGFASLTRSLNLVWAIGTIGFLGLVALWEMKRRRHWAFKTHAQRLGLIVLCFVITASTQRIVVALYKLNARNIPVVDNGTGTNDVIFIHLRSAPYTYRYETLYKQDKVFAVLYMNERLYENPIQPEIMTMPVVKLASLFQQHDYKIYRPQLGIISATAFAVGLVLWSMFCYVVPQGLQDIGQALRTRKPFPIGGMLTMGMLIYLGLYVLLTIPEPRYSFSIYPVLVCLFAYYGLQPSRWRHFVIPLFVAIISYGLTAYILLWALVAEGFL